MLATIILAIRLTHLSDYDLFYAIDIYSQSQ